MLYVFSVQLFFIVSGFLSKPIATKLFWNKLWQQLIVPMLLLSVLGIGITACKNIISGTFSTNGVVKNIIAILYGDQRTLGGLWFVYTLIFAKFIGQISNLKIKGIIAVACLIIAYYYNNYTNTTIQNSILNICTAYPMFFLGEIAGRYKEQINALEHRLILIGIAILGSVGVYFCGTYNATVWMYRGIYGSNIILWLLGSVSGTIMIYAISKLLFNFHSKVISLISEGSILILALHIHFVSVGLHFPIRYGFYLEAIVVMIIFLPAILFCQKYCPIVLGYRGCPNVSSKE